MTTAERPSLTAPAQFTLYRGAQGELLLDGKVAVVTGGASGIGYATAEALARNGAQVLIAGRRERELAAAAAQLRGHAGPVEWQAADLTRAADVVALFGHVAARFGRLDVAFNNAGTMEPRNVLADQSEHAFSAVFDTNVKALFLCMRKQIELMRQRSAGVIVNNASVSGIRNPNKGLSLYSASKAAVISLTRSAALEYAGEGIRINAVAPGRVVTAMMLSSDVGDMSAVARSLPLRRMGNPVEVANVVAWLAADSSSYVLGQVIGADGGFLAS